LKTWGSISSTISDSSDDAAGGPTVSDEPTDAFHALGSSPDAPRLLLFAVHGRSCACELSAVREIIPYRKPTRLPGAPPFVAGLVNVRGSIVTVIDLGVRLGGDAVDAEHGSIVLIEGEGGGGTKVVGLAVDELRDVQRVPSGAIEAPSADTALDGLVRGVLQAGPDGPAAGEITVVLDAGRIVADAIG
jgi:chemotaxis signal transduction protein